MDVVVLKKRRPSKAAERGGTEGKNTKRPRLTRPSPVRRAQCFVCRQDIDEGDLEEHVRECLKVRQSQRDAVDVDSDSDPPAATESREAARDDSPAATAAEDAAERSMSRRLSPKQPSATNVNFFDTFKFAGPLAGGGGPPMGGRKAGLPKRSLPDAAGPRRRPPPAKAASPRPARPPEALSPAPLSQREPRPDPDPEPPGPQDPDPAKQVEQWLALLGLGGYYTQFLELGYDTLRVCAELDGGDLAALGVLLPGARKKLLTASADLRKVLRETKRSSPPFPAVAAPASAPSESGAAAAAAPAPGGAAEVAEGTARQTAGKRPGTPPKRTPGKQKQQRPDRRALLDSRNTSDLAKLAQQTLRNRVLLHDAVAKKRGVAGALPPAAACRTVQQMKDKVLQCLTPERLPGPTPGQSPGQPAEAEAVSGCEASAPEQHGTVEAIHPQVQHFFKKSLVSMKYSADSGQDCSGSAAAAPTPGTPEGGKSAAGAHGERGLSLWTVSAIGDLPMASQEIFVLDLFRSSASPDGPKASTATTDAGPKPDLEHPEVISPGPVGGAVAAERESHGTKGGSRSERCDEEMDVDGEEGEDDDVGPHIIPCAPAAQCTALPETGVTGAGQRGPESAGQADSDGPSRPATEEQGSISSPEQQQQQVQPQVGQPQPQQQQQQQQRQEAQQQPRQPHVPVADKRPEDSPSAVSVISVASSTKDSLPRPAPCYPDLTTLPQASPGPSLPSLPSLPPKRLDFEDSSLETSQSGVPGDEASQARGPRACTPPVGPATQERPPSEAAARVLTVPSTSFGSSTTASSSTTTTTAGSTAAAGSPVDSACPPPAPAPAPAAAALPAPALVPAPSPPPDLAPVPALPPARVPGPVVAAPAYPPATDAAPAPPTSSGAHSLLARSVHAAPADACPVAAAPQFAARTAHSLLGPRQAASHAAASSLLPSRPPAIAPAPVAPDPSAVVVAASSSSTWLRASPCPPAVPQGQQQQQQQQLQHHQQQRREPAAQQQQQQHLHVGDEPSGDSGLQTSMLSHGGGIPPTAIGSLPSHPHAGEVPSGASPPGLPAAAPGAAARGDAVAATALQPVQRDGSPVADGMDEDPLQCSPPGPHRSGPGGDRPGGTPRMDAANIGSGPGDAVLPPPDRPAAGVRGPAAVEGPGDFPETSPRPGPDPTEHDRSPGGPPSDSAEATVWEEVLDIREDCWHIYLLKRQQMREAVQSAVDQFADVCRELVSLQHQSLQRLCAHYGVPLGAVLDRYTAAFPGVDVALGSGPAAPDVLPGPRLRRIHEQTGGGAGRGPRGASPAPSPARSCDDLVMEAAGAPHRRGAALSAVPLPHSPSPAAARPAVASPARCSGPLSLPPAPAPGAPTGAHARSSPWHRVGEDSDDEPPGVPSRVQPGEGGVQSASRSHGDSRGGACLGSHAARLLSDGSGFEPQLGQETPGCPGRQGMQGDPRACEPKGAGPQGEPRRAISVQSGGGPDGEGSSDESERLFPGDEELDSGNESDDCLRPLLSGLDAAAPPESCAPEPALVPEPPAKRTCRPPTPSQSIPDDASVVSIGSSSDDGTRAQDCPGALEGVGAAVGSPGAGAVWEAGAGAGPGQAEGGGTPEDREHFYDASVDAVPLSYIPEHYTLCSGLSTDLAAEPAPTPDGDPVGAGCSRDVCAPASPSGVSGACAAPGSPAVAPAPASGRPRKAPRTAPGLGEAGAPEMPQFDALPIAELKRLVATYGVKPKSREFMVAKLMQIWATEHGAGPAAAAPGAALGSPAQPTFHVSRCSLLPAPDPGLTQATQCTQPGTQGTQAQLKREALEQRWVEVIKALPAAAPDATVAEVPPGDFVKARQEFFRTRSLYERILLGETIDFAEVHGALLAHHVKCPKAHLEEFLNAQGVSWKKGWRPRSKESR